MNVIFVMSDTFRRDNLSCYGPAKAKTPRLDRFAAESFIFDNAITGSFPTIPNRLDIMSGRFSHIDHEWCPLPAKTVTLQQILTASGFVTQMIADNPHLMEMGFNYSRGFSASEWIRGQETDLWKTAPKQIKLPTGGAKNRLLHFIVANYVRNTTWWTCEEDRFAPRTIQAACRWLEENQDQEKLFLYLDLFDPHEPWDAPKKYLDLYEQGYHGEEVYYPQYDFWREFLSEEELDHIRNLYLAEATMVDHWFGVLLDKVNELGLSDDTAVIFVTDHGYLFGEHDLTGKSLMPERGDGVTLSYEAIPMYSDVRRIPLMIRLPGQRQGKHLSGLVQPPDLMPTILEMAGLVATEGVKGQARIQTLQCGMFTAEDWEFNPETIHGKSMMPLMRGETDRLRDIAVSSNTLTQHTPVLAKCAIVTENGWCLHYAGKYDEAARGAKMYTNHLVDLDKVRISTAPALHCLREDPQEARNVIEGNEGLAREIHRRYVAFLEEAGTPEEHLAGRTQLR
jgi:arylsulfatase A-like enzyme